MPCKGPPLWDRDGDGDGDGDGDTCCSCRMSKYAALSREDVPENLAMMFITFPAAKDPTYEERHPGGVGGSSLCPLPPDPTHVVARAQHRSHPKGWVMGWARGGMSP